MELHDRVKDFVTRTLAALGVPLDVTISESPDSVRLYAGCGVVEGSVPEAELAETWAKFRPMLESLGIST